MGDTSVRVPGYNVLDRATSADSDDDDLDIIEMTPRNQDSNTVQRGHSDHWFAYSQWSFVETPSNLSVPQRASSPSFRGNDGSPPSIGSGAGSPESPPSLSKRDPSVSNGVDRDVSDEDGILRSFVSGLAKALGGDDDFESPSSVMEKAKDREREIDVHEDAASSTSVSPSQGSRAESSQFSRSVQSLPVPRSLTDGENELLREDPLFTDQSDPEAREFATFIDEDGAAARHPVISLSDYWRGQEPSDLWAFPHNALRRELFDMYEMMGVIRLRYLSLTWGDVYDLRAWWRLFHLFWRQYIATESRILDPFVQRAIGTGDTGRQTKRSLAPLRDAREWLMLKFEEVNGYIEEFEGIPTGRALCLLAKTTDALAFKMLDYFNKQESLLPNLVEAHFSASTALAVELATLDMIRESPFVEESFVHYMRWMPSGKDRTRWVTTRLRWGERASTRRMYRRYAETRGGIVDRFREKLKL